MKVCKQDDTIPKEKGWRGGDGTLLIDYLLGEAHDKLRQGSFRTGE